MGPIILCHAFEDKKVVRRVYDALLASGFEVWIDSESVFGEQEGEPDIANWLDQAACMLVFLSKNSVRTMGATHHEFGQLIHTWKQMPEGAIHTIPVRINDCEIPKVLSRLDPIDLFDDQGLEHVIHRLHKGRAKRQQLGPDGEAQASGQKSGEHGRIDAIGDVHIAVDGQGDVVDVPSTFRDL